MQTQGGGKHDILPVARPVRDHAVLPVNDAPQSRCETVPPFGDEHEGVHGASEFVVANAILSEDIWCKIASTAWREWRERMEKKRCRQERRRAELGAQDNCYE